MTCQLDLIMKEMDRKCMQGSEQGQLFLSFDPIYLGCSAWTGKILNSWIIACGCYTCFFRIAWLKLHIQ